MGINAGLAELIIVGIVISMRNTSRDKGDEMYGKERTSDRKINRKK